MNEANFTYKLTRALRQALPGVVVFKHSDRFTKGIPDVSITANYATRWVEVKLSTNKQFFEPVQLETLRRLNGYYLIWDPAARLGDCFRAADVDRIAGLPNYTESFQEIVRRLLDDAE